MRDVTLESLTCLMQANDKIIVKSWDQPEDEFFYLSSDNSGNFKNQTEIETTPYNVDFNDMFTVLKKFRVCKVQTLEDVCYINVEAPKLENFLRMYDIDWHNCRFSIEIYSSDENERKYNETFTGNFDEVLNHFKDKGDVVLWNILVDYKLENGVYCLKFYSHRDALSFMYN